MQATLTFIVISSPKEHLPDFKLGSKTYRWRCALNTKYVFILIFWVFKKQFKRYKSIVN